MANTVGLRSISSEGVETLSKRLRAAGIRWQEANSRYLQRRMAWDVARLANLAQEAALYVDFANAKYDVKQATDAYYAVVSEVSRLKTAVNSEKTARRIAELMSQLKEAQDSLARSTRSKTERILSSL